MAFSPKAIHAPRDEAELLDVLRAHRGERVRAFGGLHAWSAAAATTGVAIDTRRLDHVRVETTGAGPPPTFQVRVGAGCTIQRLLEEMHEQAGVTLPSLGLIRQQTVAGATATGTHGSGKHSMSHYVVGARVAVFDVETGEPTIRVIETGATLEAIRCALGTMGVVTELTLQARPQYNVREHFRQYNSLHAVLEAEREFPIQQFYLVPWSWRYLAQHRTETTAARSWAAPLYRAYWVTILDVGMHLVILLLTRILKSPRAVRVFFARMVRWFVPTGWAVVDRADRQLTMNHHWFRHIEIELFVERDRLEPALAFTADLLRSLHGEDLSPGAAATLASAGCLEEAGALKGRYTHHYPICVRKVLPDQTMISMAAEAMEARYAISFISYAPPHARESFVAVAELLTRVMGKEFNARPHWGKVCPLGPADVHRLYPRLGEFLEMRDAFDPEGRFLNEWTAGLFTGSTPSGSGLGA